MIYVIYVVETKNIKIGYSTNPTKRLKELQTANPYRLNLIHVEKGDYIKEKTIHNKLKKYSLIGEWFSYEQCKHILSKVLDEWVEIELDYTQFYHSIFNYCKNFRNKYCILYLLWIIPKASKENCIPHGTKVFNSFINELQEKPAIGTIKNAISELVKHKVIIKHSLGNYQLNPAILWGDDVNKRIEHLKMMKEDDVIYELNSTDVKVINSRPI